MEINYENNTFLKEKTQRNKIKVNENERENEDKPEKIAKKIEMAGNKTIWQRRGIGNINRRANKKEKNSNS